MSPLATSSWAAAPPRGRAAAGRTPRRRIGTYPFAPTRAWRVFIAMCVLAVVVCAIFENRYEFQTREFVRAARVAQLQSRAGLNAFFEDEANEQGVLFKPRAGSGPLQRRSRDELLAHLFPKGPPADARDDPWTGTAVWPDVERGFAWRFRFGPDGTWTEFLPTALPSSARLPTRHPWFDLGQRYLRKCVRPLMWRLPPGPTLWVLLFAAALPPTRQALRLAHAQLAVAVTCLVGWVVHPHVLTLSARWETSRDVLLGSCMVLSASLALAVVRRRPQIWPDPAMCQQCGYDLTGNVTGRCPECGAERLPGPLLASDVM